MKIKSLFSNQDEITIESYLCKCGVDNVEEYLKGGFDGVESVLSYDSIEHAYCTLMGVVKEIKNSSYKKYLDTGILQDKIYIIQDSDCDGLTSSVCAYQYLLHLGVPTDNIKVLFHTGKQHGLSDDINIWYDCRLLWMPDAGTNDIDRCKELTDHNVSIIITDHHNANKPNPYAIVINNQTSPNVKNKALAGVGVTFKFIQYCCQMDMDKFYHKLIDLVALGNLSDVMEMNGLENRAFNVWGLSHIKNEFFRVLCDNRISNYFCITPKNIVWNITPLINSVCRSDNQELKSLMFFAFVGVNTDYYSVLEQLIDQHEKQQNDTLEMYNSLIERVPETEDKVMIIECENTPYTGLVANKLRDYYKKPVLLVHKEGNQYIGSCRAYTNLLTPLIYSELMTICAGHDNVFGVGWLEENTDRLKEYLNTLNLDNKIQEVAWIVTEQPKRELFAMSDKYDNIWGKGVPNPQYYFHMSFNDIKDIKILGKNKNTIKFTCGGIDFLKFQESEKPKGNFLNVVGTLGLNIYRGRENMQCIIDEWEIE